jgi:hypothetical protein
MELINRKHNEISEKTRLRLEAYFKIYDEGSCFFSAGAVINFGLSPGLYVHFHNDELNWYFYCNNDSDGFKLSAASGQGRKPVLICNKSLVNLIRKRTGCIIGTRFPIKLTSAKQNGDHLLEINFGKPFEISTMAIMKPKQLKDNPAITNTKKLSKKNK